MGSQCFLLGSDHLPGLGLGIENLLPSEINQNCANSMTAGNLGVFFAKVRGENHETGEVVEARTMVYVTGQYDTGLASSIGDFGVYTQNIS